MLVHTDTRRGNHFYLERESTIRSREWKSNMDAVRATIKFAIATGRLDTGMELPINN
jgi:hypothetical protein